MKDPASAAAKWVRNLQSATQSMVDGSNAVTQSPAVAAKAAKPRMIARWTAAMQDGGKWDTAMAKVTVDTWRTGYQQKGIPRIGQGAQAAQAKVTAKLQSIMAYQATGIDTIRKMQNNNISDAQAKASAWILFMSKYKG